MNSASAVRLADSLDRSTASPITANGAPASAAWPVAILGVAFDPVTIQDAIGRINDMIASRQTHYVVTANVDFLVQAHRDVELRRILLEADLVLCDGTPLVWASRWLGNALPERVAGSDLVPALLQSAAREGQRIFLLGAAEGVGAAAAARLRQQYPEINVVGHYSPPFSSLLEMDHDEILRRVRDAAPDILLVSFGCPKQEKWIAMHHRALGVPVTIGVGATLDFLAGRMRRAPAWMRRTGTEWLYRLAQEPRRLYRRYTTDFVCFVPAFTLQWWKIFPRRKANAKARELPSPREGWRLIDAGEHLTRPALHIQASFWRELQVHAAHCLLDLTRLHSIDATGVALLSRWRKALQKESCHLVLLAPSSAVRNVLRELKLTDHFLIVENQQAVERLTHARFTRGVAQSEGTTRSMIWHGELIAANAAEVWQSTEEQVRAFAAEGATLIIVDLADVRFIDSSGAALMLRLKRWCQSHQLEVLFTRPVPNIRSVLRLTGLEGLLLEAGQ